MKIQNKIEMSIAVNKDIVKPLFKHISCIEFPSSSKYHNHLRFKYFIMAGHTGCVEFPSSRNFGRFNSFSCQR
jgi:hypothetical protein